MFELRWLTESWTSYEDGFIAKRSGDKKLQYRIIENPLEAGLQDPIWSDWIDVPHEHIDI